MKKVARSVVLALAAALLLAAPQNTAKAQDSENAEQVPLKVAVVNLQALTQRASAMEAVREEVERIRRQLSARAQEDQQQIRDRAEQLERQRRVLRPEVFQERLDVLRTQMVEIRQRVQQQRNALQQSVQETVSRFQQTVVQVIQEMSVEQGYTLVLDASAALHASPAYDITEAVMGRVNERLPNLEFEFTDPTSGQNSEGGNTTGTDDQN